MRVLFLLFIALPVIELWLLFQVGGEIGFLPTVALVLATGALGVHILRRQGFNTLRRAQSRMQAGELPGQELLEGFFIVTGGVLLLTPGFITDLVAILFLLPFTRRAMGRYLMDSGRIATWTRQSKPDFAFMHRGGVHRQRGAETQDVYEGEFTREQAGKPLPDPDASSRNIDDSAK